MTLRKECTQEKRLLYHLSYHLARSSVPLITITNAAELNYWIIGNVKMNISLSGMNIFTTEAEEKFQLFIQPV